MLTPAQKEEANRAAVEEEPPDWGGPDEEEPAEQEEIGEAYDLVEFMSKKSCSTLSDHKKKIVRAQLLFIETSARIDGSEIGSQRQGTIRPRGRIYQTAILGNGSHGTDGI